MKYILVLLFLAACCPEPREVVHYEYLDRSLVGKCFIHARYPYEPFIFTKIAHNDYYYEFIQKSCDYNNPNTCVVSTYGGGLVAPHGLDRVIGHDINGKRKEIKCPIKPEDVK